METIDNLLQQAVALAWGPPLVILLMGGGLFLTIASRGLPIFGLKHAYHILRGKFDRPDDPGDINHFQALSTALSSTIGLGNIGGVAIAITQGGPGAIFWMWLAAFVGMATKFFTCTLAVMYRGPDSSGHIQGGPMYYIEHGLGRRFKPLAMMFAFCGMVGCLPIFQTNQIAAIVHQAVSVPKWATGVVCTVIAIVVIIGGVKRIALVASRLVPMMCLLYLFCASIIAFRNFHLIPTVFGQIFHDAFSGTAALGGAEGIAFATVIATGVKRAAFSNEAGIGTAPMAHGAARTTEPVREGLVAMIGPFIDTIVVCTLTAFIILSSGLWQTSGIEGVTLTLQAFEAGLGTAGASVLVLMVVLFGMSTVFGYAYYAKKCFSYLFGVHNARYYEVFYLVSLMGGAVWSAAAVVNLIDCAFALMAIPNVIATLLLAPKVIGATRDYLERTGINWPGRRSSS
ncbi:MAG: alanine:cation symporter family protein [bacterium]|nr:alanine:cation symporter family protein [bacterium]